MSRHGNIESGNVICKNSTICEFSLKMTQKMMPQSTVYVYNVRDEVRISQGKIDVRTEELGANYV